VGNKPAFGQPGLFTKVRREGDEMREKTVWRALEGAQSYEQYDEHLEGARACFHAYRQPQQKTHE